MNDGDYNREDMQVRPDGEQIRPDVKPNVKPDMNKSGLMKGVRISFGADYLNRIAGTSGPRYSIYPNRAFQPEVVKNIDSDSNEHFYGTRISIYPNTFTGNAVVDNSDRLISNCPRTSVFPNRDDRGPKTNTGADENSNIYVNYSPAQETNTIQYVL